MRPADASVATLLLSVLVSARPSGGHWFGPADGPADSGAPPTASDQLGPAKVKRNVRTSEETRMLVSSTGYALEILPNGAVNTTTNKSGSPYAVLNITSNKTIKHSDVQRHYTLRGVASGRYLCLSKKRQAFSSKYLRQNRCRFRMDLKSGEYFIVSLYEECKGRRLQLAITKQGAVRVRIVRTHKQRCHRKRAGGPLRPTTGDNSTVGSTTEPTGRQQSRRQLPPGSSSSPSPSSSSPSSSPSSSSPSPRRRLRPLARQGGRQQRAQRKAQRRQKRRRLRRQREKKRRQREKKQRRQQRAKKQRRRRPTRFGRRVRSGDGGSRALLPSERVQAGSRRARHRHQRGRPGYKLQLPPRFKFWVLPVKAKALQEALRLERERLAEFAARCRSGSDRGPTSWQRHACGSLRVKRFSAEPPRLTTPEGGSQTAAPPPPLAGPRTPRPVTALTVSHTRATDTSDAARDVSDARDTGDARDVRPPPVSTVSRLDCVRRRVPGGADRCRQWRATRRKYKLYLQYRRDLRRLGML